MNTPICPICKSKNLEIIESDYWYSTFVNCHNCHTTFDTDDFLLNNRTLAEVLATILQP